MCRIFLTCWLVGFIALPLSSAADQSSSSVKVHIANDDDSLQSAVDQVAQRGGGVVRIGPGRFTLRNGLRLRSGVKVIGTPEKTVLVLCPGKKSALAADVRKGDTKITLVQAAGFEVGDGVALEDRAGHGFEVTTATLSECLGPSSFRLSEPAQNDYLLERGAEVKRAFSGVGGWNIKDAAVEGLTIEGNFGQDGSEYLGGCRGGGVYLFSCENVTVRNCSVRKYNGDAISFQGKCRGITIEECLCEYNANVGMHPGSGSVSCLVRKNTLRKNGYVGLFVCVGVQQVRFEENDINGNGGCGISIGFADSDNLFRGNRIINNAETGVLFRRDSKREQDGAHRNVFEGNIIRDNLGARPEKSNSRPGSAGKACVVIEGAHHGLIFRNNDFGFTQAHPGCAILHDADAQNLQLIDNRLHNVNRLSDAAPLSTR